MKITYERLGYQIRLSHGLHQDGLSRCLDRPNVGSRHSTSKVKNSLTHSYSTERLLRTQPQDQALKHQAQDVVKHCALVITKCEQLSRLPPTVKLINQKPWEQRSQGFIAFAYIDLWRTSSHVVLLMDVTFSVV